MGIAIVLWRFCGVVAAILAWIVIALAVSRNPWFNVFKHALSDLGDLKGANDPWIYNVGLIVTGVITCIYSLYIAYTSNNKVLVFASALLFVAGIFLALIGVYPAGTRPHTFVSTWFFIQMLLAIIAIAIGFTVEKALLHAAILWIISVIGPLGAILIKWPSVALQEIYGIILIDIAIVTITTKI